MIGMRLMNISAKSSRTRFDCTFSNETARVNRFWGSISNILAASKVLASAAKECA